MSENRYSTYVFVPAELAEEVELPLELKKEILYLHAHLATFDHWQLLGLPWNAPAGAVRSAYVEKVKIFHPDRHAGRKLGSYLLRIEKIFRALTDARDLLCDESGRAAYARKTMPAEECARADARRLDDAARTQERRARLARGNPLLARAARVQELLERGKQAMSERKYAQAANDFLTVAGLDPRNLEARSLAEDAKQRAGAERARTLYESALAAETVGNRAGALATLREAVASDPSSVRYPIAAARIALDSGDLALARTFAEQAVRVAPRDGRALEALGGVLHALGEAKEARRVLERALSFNPELATAKALMKKLRWSLLG